MAPMHRIRSHRRALIGAATAFSLVVVAGCSAGSDKDEAGSSGTAGGGGSNETVAVGLVAEPASLDFTTSDGAAIPQLELGNIYETLVKQDQNGKVVPALATAWTVSPDRKTYTFDLAKDVTFSNGAKLTADDVVFSIDRVKTKWTTGIKAGMEPVASATAVTPNQVKVVLKQPSNSWLFNMTGRIGAVFSKDGVADLANKPIGTGPYVFSSWTRGDSITLTRNDSYWGKKPYFKTVKMRYFKDPTALNNALLSKTINVISTVQAPDALSSFPTSTYQVIEGTTNGEIVLSMNNAKGPFANKKVRQAARYAIDNKGVMDSCWAGRGELIGSMVPPTDPWYEDLTKVTPYNQQKARDLLKEAGTPKPSIRLRLPSLPYATACGPVVKSMLEQVGFSVKTDTLEFPAAWLQDVFKNADYDMSMIAHVEPRDLPTVFGNPQYYTRYSNPQIQTYLKAADTGTEAEQVSNMKKAARLLADDAAADFLFLLPNLMVADKNITGLPKNAITEGFDLAGLARS